MERAGRGKSGKSDEGREKEGGGGKRNVCASAFLMLLFSLCTLSKVAQKVSLPLLLLIPFFSSLCVGILTLHRDIYKVNTHARAHTA